jgi:drug/metabolite transporter (DMT)-like permease/ABC-type branched-subunit amino acid transport system substrate-binding protein
MVKSQGNFMIYVVISAIIFGLVHPGSKLILGRDIDLLSFCLLYVAIRLLVQIPVVIKTGHYRLQSRKQGFILLSIGIVGAILQLSEFMGIANGLPVPIVTFLVYTHPLWTMILGVAINGDKISAFSYLKLILGIGGSALILLGHLQSFVGTGVHQLIAPIFAGFMIALWICLSGKAKKEGASAWTVSFYYDLFALISLLVIRTSGLVPTMPLTGIVTFLSKPQNFLMISCYSIFVGLLPNLLFYRGSQNISSLTCGLILLLEPVVASLTSNFIWNSPLPHFFFVGAGLVLLGGSPIENFPMKKWAKEFSTSKVVRGAARIASAILVLVLYGSHVEASTNILHLVQMVPSEESNYTNSKEMKSIDISSDLATGDFKKKHPECSFSVEKVLLRGTEEELFTRIAKISKDAKDSEIIVGMSRSSFARVAASAAKGSNIKAISIGAATTNLAEINKNFFSIVSPWTRQWAAIENEMKRKNCTNTTTFGFFDPADFLSRNFRKVFEEKFGASQSFSIEELVQESGIVSKKIISNGSCFFLAVNFSKAERPLTEIAKHNLRLTILGIGDWNYYATELNILLKKTAQPWEVAAPTGWTPTVSPASVAFTNQIERLIHESPSPVAAYTYDAILVALYSLCNHVKPDQMKPLTLKKIGLLRNYDGLAESNNFTSPMQIVRFKGGNRL